MDSTLPPPLPDPFPGEYRFVRKLGSGGYGTVWLAEDLGLGGRPVAIKTLRPSRDLKDADRALAALRHEAGLLGRIDHPNVTRVHTIRQMNGVHYLVMRYVPGGSLADRLRAGPLPWVAATRYAADVGEGLAEVHRRGVIHRDVKPDNILWDQSADEAVLTDFGVAARLAEPGTAAGTTPYMAPEAISTAPAPALDVYALAASLFELAAGEVPFGRGEFAVVAARAELGLPSPEPRLAWVPDGIDRLIRAGLAADPTKRLPLVEFVAILRAALNRALTDSLTTGPARLQLTVRRFGPGGVQQPMALSVRPAVVIKLWRNVERVPPDLPSVRLQTGDRVRIEVTADRPGYVTVFNVGPTGNLDLLCPAAPDRPGERVEAGHATAVADAELTPPAGQERVFAVWTARPVALAATDLRAVAPEGTVSRAYAATRDLQRLSSALARLPADERAAVVVELDHGPGQVT
jgi:serine/threonine-protein kinase